MKTMEFDSLLEKQIDVVNAYTLGLVTKEGAIKLLRRLKLSKKDAEDTIENTGVLKIFQR